MSLLDEFQIVNLASQVTRRVNGRCSLRRCPVPCYPRALRVDQHAIHIKNNLAWARLRNGAKTIKRLVSWPRHP